MKKCELRLLNSWRWDLSKHSWLRYQWCVWTFFLVITKSEDCMKSISPTGVMSVLGQYLQCFLPESLKGRFFMTWISIHYRHLTYSFTVHYWQSSFILMLHHSHHCPPVAITSHPHNGSPLLPQRNTLMAWRTGTAIQSQSRRRRLWSCPKRRKRRRRRIREPLVMQIKMWMRQRCLQIPRKRRRRRSGCFEQWMFCWGGPEMWPVCCWLLTCDEVQPVCALMPCYIGCTCLQGGVVMAAVLFWGTTQVLNDVLIAVVLCWDVAHLVDAEWCCVECL